MSQLRSGFKGLAVAPVADLRSLLEGRRAGLMAKGGSAQKRQLEVFNSKPLKEEEEEA